MKNSLILASASEIRRNLLRNAGVYAESIPADINEAALKSELIAGSQAPTEIATALAKEKARTVSIMHQHALVLGCDQVLCHRKNLMSKPKDPGEASAQITRLSGDVHHLISAAAVFKGGICQWTSVGEVHMHMHSLSGAYITDYVARNWHSIQHAVGAYKLEEEGARLFEKIEGDHFHVLGLPLLEVLSYLVERGVIDR